MRFVMLIFASLVVAPGPAFAHPGLHAEAGALTYLISSAVTAVLVAGCILASRRVGRR